MAPEARTRTIDRPDAAVGGAEIVLCRGSRRAFTLAESLIASVYLAAAVIGISGVLSATYQHSAAYGTSATGLSLAQELMEEISARPAVLAAGTVDQPGWPTVTDRTKYDTVDDYNGYSDVGSSITTASGSTIDASDGGSFIRTVTVTANAIPAGMTGTASDFLLVTVTVQMPKTETIKISQLFTKATICR
jgi:Tfp pilus assembly protein PilV